eukprot:6214053-Pleurochrysis_carterae.AAC.9
MRTPFRANASSLLCTSGCVGKPRSQASICTTGTKRPNWPAPKQRNTRVYVSGCVRRNTLAAACPGHQQSLRYPSTRWPTVALKAVGTRGTCRIRRGDT